MTIFSASLFPSHIAIALRTGLFDRSILIYPFTRGAEVVALEII